MKTIKNITRICEVNALANKIHKYIASQSELMESKCIYCDNMTTDDTRHFESQCCGRGMCDTCYGNLQGTDEQIQLDFFDDEDNIIKDEYKNATYLCFDCADIWKIKKQNN